LALIALFGCQEADEPANVSQNEKPISIIPNTDDPFPNHSLSDYLCNSETEHYFNIEKILSYNSSDKIEIHNILKNVSADYPVCIKKSLVALAILGDKSDIETIQNYILGANGTITRMRFHLSVYATMMLGGLVAKTTLPDSSSNSGLDFLMNCSDNPSYWQSKLDKIKITDNSFVDKDIAVSKMDSSCMNGLSYTMNDTALSKLEYIRDNSKSDSSKSSAKIAIRIFNEVKEHQSIVEYYMDKYSH